MVVVQGGERRAQLAVVAVVAVQGGRQGGGRRAAQLPWYRGRRAGRAESGESGAACRGIVVIIVQGRAESSAAYAKFAMMF